MIKGTCTKVKKDYIVERILHKNRADEIGIFSTVLIFSFSLEMYLSHDTTDIPTHDSSEMYEGKQVFWVVLFLTDLISCKYSQTGPVTMSRTDMTHDISSV